MVTAEGDGIRRDVMYAKFREDKEATPGYTRELVSVDIDPKTYDDLDNVPDLKDKPDTMVKLFKIQVEKRPNYDFLGTREVLANGEFGQYKFKTYKEIWDISQYVAKGILELGLAPLD